MELPSIFKYTYLCGKCTTPLPQHPDPMSPPTLQFIKEKHLFLDEYEQCLQDHMCSRKVFVEKNGETGSGCFGEDPLACELVYRIIECQECKRGVTESTVETHMKRIHRIIWPAVDADGPPSGSSESPQVAVAVRLPVGQTKAVPAAQGVTGIADCTQDVSHIGLNDRGLKVKTEPFEVTSLLTESPVCDVRTSNSLTTTAENGKVKVLACRIIWSEGLYKVDNTKTCGADHGETTIVPLIPDPKLQGELLEEAKEGTRLEPANVSGQKTENNVGDGETLELKATVAGRDSMASDSFDPEKRARSSSGRSSKPDRRSRKTRRGNRRPSPKKPKVTMTESTKPSGVQPSKKFVCLCGEVELSQSKFDAHCRRHIDSGTRTAAETERTCPRMFCHYLAYDDQDYMRHCVRHIVLQHSFQRPLTNGGHVNVPYVPDAISGGPNSAVQSGDQKHTL